MTILLEEGASLKDRVEAIRYYSFIRDISIFEEEDVEIRFFENKAMVDKLPYFIACNQFSDNVSLNNIVSWSFEKGELLDIEKNMIDIYKQRLIPFEKAPICEIEIKVTDTIFAIESSFNSSAKRKKSFFRILSLGTGDISYICGPIKARSRLDTVFLQISSEDKKTDEKFDIPVNLELFYQILKYGFYDSSVISICVTDDGFVLKHKYKAEQYFLNKDVL